MVPSVRRRRRKAAGILSDAEQSNSPPKLLRFCKIIVNPRSDVLRIPMEFARRYGPDLPKRVYLRAPIGPEFEVELVSSNGEMWLHKGWDDFKEYYSLDFGHYLVFQYEVESYKFHVLIFEMTASEIEYPHQKPANIVKVEYIGSDDDGDDSGPILKQPFRNQRGKAKISDKGCDNQTERRGSALNPRKRGKFEKTIDKNRSIVYQRAKAFKSANPHFISLIQSAYVSGAFVLAIPVSFVKTNMPSKSNQIKLRNRDGKQWPVKCSIHEPNYGRLHGGWMQFVEDNGLKVGDVCVFEISKTSKFLWNVSIFRS